MSDNFKHTAGLQNVGSYQVSGKPFVTASTVTDGAEQQIEFPEVSNSITVKLDSAGGFTKSILEVGDEGTDDGVSDSWNAQGSIVTDPSAIAASSPDGFTVSLWIRTPPASPNQKTGAFSVNFFPSGGRQRGFIFRTRHSHKRFGYNYYLYPTNDNIATGEVAPFSGVDYFHSYDYNEIYNVVFALSGGAVSTHDKTISIYVNGSLVESHINSTYGTYYAGQLSNMQLNRTDGSSLDFLNIAIWTKCFNESEVQSLYDSENTYVDPTTVNSSDLRNNFIFDPSNGDTTTSINDTLGSFSIDVPGASLGSDGVGLANYQTVTFGGAGGELRVHFRSTGSLPNVATNKHYWTLDSQNESITMNVKSKELYLSADGGDCDYSVEAELTNIPSSRMFQHTGSGVDE
tara:strand:+ start:1332 stop:2537 length:1206 start_codon:yes stop_codon:yes gene_type:complete